MMKSKEALRAHYKKIRGELSAERRCAAAEKLKIIGLEKVKGIKCVLSFSSTQSEINTAPLNDMLFANGQLVLPVICSDSLQLLRPAGDLIPGPLGILEPDPKTSEQVPIESIGLIFVPGLVFDRQGHRIGYGKGHYDKLLSATTAPSIGLGFHEQVTDQIPSDPWDIPVDEILST